MRAKILSAAYDHDTPLDNPALAAAQSGADIPIDPLGSGSDYTAFYHHLGLPALNVGYGGEGATGGVYHSVYDSYDHYIRYGDPGFKYGAALSKTVGRLVLRIADADTVPQRFADFANTVDRYLQEVKKLEEARRNGDRLRDKMERNGDFRIAEDPLEPVDPPKAEPLTPHVELAVLEDAVDRLKASATAYDSAYADKSSGLTPERRDRLNAMLRDIDQLLILPQGLPFRPWYKNLISAAGRFTGYGAKTLPGRARGDRGTALRRRRGLCALHRRLAQRLCGAARRGAQAAGGEMIEKTAFITGATAGIGAATARLFAREGWKVVGTGRRQDRLDALAAELGDGFHPFSFDMTDEAAVDHALEALPPGFRDIDLLVNNAGLALGTQPAQETKLSDWRTMIETNVTGLVAITRILLPTLIARKGMIINLSSVAGTYPYRGGNVYGATKAFVRQFSLGLRSDLHGTGVRVASIEPGMVETEFTTVRTRGDKAASDALYRGVDPLTAEDIADTFWWIANLPPHVNINALEIMPVNQSFAGFQVARDT